jgi:hypothetical protein
MYGLLVADVARQEYKDWERRFYKRVGRRSAEIGVAAAAPAEGLVARLKRLF